MSLHVDQPMNNPKTPPLAPLCNFRGHYLAWYQEEHSARTPRESGCMRPVHGNRHIRTTL
jgi:hypothetical protein